MTASVEAGQLRVWTHTGHTPTEGKLFMVVCKGKQSGPHVVWHFIIDGQKDWHFEEVILSDSEVVSDS